MILRQISLSNFGIYRGDFTFDLAPVSSDMFSRPIVFFAGKNGVGKTTLSEAIRLGLYGALARGAWKYHMATTSLRSGSNKCAQNS